MAMTAVRGGQHGLNASLAISESYGGPSAIATGSNVQLKHDWAASPTSASSSAKRRFLLQPDSNSACSAVHVPPTQALGMRVSIGLDASSTKLCGRRPSAGHQRGLRAFRTPAEISGTVESWAPAYAQLSSLPVSVLTMGQQETLALSESLTPREGQKTCEELWQ